MATDSRPIKTFMSAKDEMRKAAVFICNAGSGIAEDDYTTQDTEIEKLCTHRIMEGFTESPDGSRLTFTLANGGYDTRIRPLLFVGGAAKHGDDGTYGHSWNAATGVITFTTAPASGTELKAIVDGRLAAAITVDIPGLTIDIKQEDITAIGATAASETLRTVGTGTFGDAVVSVYPNVSVDTDQQAEAYPGHHFECLMYGLSQWPNDTSWREIAMNANPAVMSIVFYDEADSVTSGDIKYKEYRIYGLKFKGFAPDQLGSTNKSHQQKWTLSVKNVKTRLGKVA